MKHTTNCEKCLATIYNLEGKKCEKQNCPIVMKDQPEPYGFKSECIGNDAPETIVQHHRRIYVEPNEHDGMPQIVKK